MAVQYTRAGSVEGTRTTEIPRGGQTVSGYGGAIPTRHMIKYLGVWRRVYVMAYGNGGTPYVKVGGESVVLDDVTQERVKGV